ncbi:MAG: hypothetical protein JXK07_13380 [Spirochaetes bacterium]|nr:hypothetical protein [Spirochaetota bacterium]
MKVHIVSVFLLFLTISATAEYRALSHKDRAEFLNSFQAVKIALAEKNYQAIIRFVPEIITRYESIMLDPDCKTIRPHFLSMNQMLREARNIRATDSLEAIIAEKKATCNTYQLLQVYDSILPVMSVLDTSLYQSHLSYYNGLAITLANSKTVDNYSLLSSLRHIDNSVLESFLRTINDKFNMKIAQLSASMNPDSIYAFHVQYPNIRRDDIVALLDRSRLAMRHSLLRKPSLLGYKDYKKIFGDDPTLKDALSKQAFKSSLGSIPDPSAIKEYIAYFPEDGSAIWNRFEDSLFIKWSSWRSTTNTNAYLKLFPQGKYAAIIQDHVTSADAVSAYSPEYFPELRKKK